MGGAPGVAYRERAYCSMRDGDRGCFSLCANVRRRPISRPCHQVKAKETCVHHVPSQYPDPREIVAKLAQIEQKAGRQ